MSAIKINEANGSDDETGRDGGILTADQKLRMYTLKEIVNTEDEYTKLLQYIVDVRGSYNNARVAFNNNDS